MATIKNLLDSWQKLPLNKVITDSFEATQRNYIELQKAQLYVGQRVQGDLIGDYQPYQSENYSIKKHAMNPAPGEGNPDLHLHGGYYDGIKTDVTDDKIHIESTDEKWPNLDKRYPGSLSGLNENFKPKYLPLVQKVIIKKVKSEL